MAEQKATNVHWHEGDITREHRGKILGHKGATLWFTGLSGSGKSTVAVELARHPPARERCGKRGVQPRREADRLRPARRRHIPCVEGRRDGRAHGSPRARGLGFWCRLQPGRHACA